MNPAAHLTDFELESRFTRARKTRDLAAALRYVFEELDRERCAHLPPVVAAVVGEVASRFNTTRDTLLGRTDKKALKRARVIAWWLLHYRFDAMSYPQIGKAFAGRSHATILKLVAELSSEMKADDRLATLVASVEAAVMGELVRKAA
jgi:chromosomal replication initiation ATPase DnaA